MLPIETPEPRLTGQHISTEPLATPAGPVRLLIDTFSDGTVQASIKAEGERTWGVAVDLEPIPVEGSEVTC